MFSCPCYRSSDLWEGPSGYYLNRASLIALPSFRDFLPSEQKMGVKLLALFWVWLALSYSFYVSPAVVSAAITTPLPDLYEASVIELQAGLTSGQFTSVDLVKVCKPVGIVLSYRLPELALIELWK
jgi:hypothetical protein